MLELAENDASELTQSATAIAEITGKSMVYQNLSKVEYRRILEGVGLSTPVADMLAESDTKAAHETLYDDGHALSRLIGRPTLPSHATLRAMLRG